ncbi:MAG: ABC transporter ATP-binding protein, partial [Paracoccaceae bacterium]|nr:ABC transporter ATP-binding protein [Paracoccaceae bacterium]
PSGCGKSTTLFAVCGIHRMNGGKLYFGGKDVTTLPAQERSVGVVFQNYALYPHMTVEQNIGFPLKVQKLPKPKIRTEVERLAELVQIGELLDRRPAQLSGGQQQRVALARAMIRKPDVLLLDEPLANLDAKLRLEMRSEIRRIQRETGITAILVTHDQVEAMSMCDRIALMRDGKIVQLDTPEQMYVNPCSQFVAGFLGNPPISFLPAVVGDVLSFGHDQTLARPSALEVSEEVVVGIRPEHFGPQHGIGLQGEVTFIESQGREVLIDVRLDGGGEIRSILPAGEPIRAGQRINWGVATESILAFAPNGDRL